MKDGIIESGSPAGIRFGFTRDRFLGYLWKDGQEIIVSAIKSLSPGQGHLSELFRNIKAAGYAIAVPEPLAHMESILRRKGFMQTFRPLDTGTGEVEVWVEPAKEAP